MTKVQAQYQLTQPLDETLLEAIDRAHGIYGLLRVQVDNSGKSLMIEYDASRLALTDVDKALRRSGLPAVRS